MKARLLFAGFVFVAVIVAVACTSAQPTIVPTPVPTIAPATPTEMPPTDTVVPPTDTVIPPTADPHIAGADCVGCHAEEHKRWSTTLHAADPAAVLTNPEHDEEELLVDECVSCHAPFQAAKFHVGDFVQPLDQKGPWHVVDANVSQWQAIRCEVCHNPASSAPKKLAFYDPSAQTYVTVKDSTELCEKCHQPGTDDSRDLKGSVHEGLQCAACHFQPGTEMSLDAHQACTQCHPGVNPKHPDITTLDTTFLSPDSANDIHFVTCANCHPQGTPTPTK